MAYSGKSSTSFPIPSLRHVDLCTLPHMNTASHELPSSLQAMSALYLNETHTWLTFCQVLCISCCWCVGHSCCMRVDTFTKCLTLPSETDLCCSSHTLLLIGVYETKLLLQSVQPHTSLSPQLELPLLEGKTQRHHLHLLSATSTAQLLTRR